MTPDAQALCVEVRAAIVRTGWSESARRAGVDRANLHRAFSGRLNRGRLPSLETVALVADALGLELAVRPRGQVQP